MTRLVTPTVHLNGTSKEELVQGRIAVIEAAQALRDALQRAAPNARDYYPQGDDAYKLARAAWTERQLMIDKLIDDVQMDAMKITLEGLE